MDELKNNAQEAQEALELQEALEAREDYPFIVEITAAMLIDNCGIKEAKEWTEDPGLANNIFVLIDYIGSMSQKLNQQDPAYARPNSVILKFYEQITGYKPELDPESLSFNFEQYNAAVAEMGADRFLDGVRSRLAEMIKEQEAIEELLPDLIGFGYEVQKAVSDLYSVLKSDRLLEVFRRAKAEAEAEAKGKALKPPTVLDQKQMLQLKGKVFDAFSQARFPKERKNVIEVNKSGKVFKFYFSDLQRLKGKIGISTHKLLSVAISQFTQNNHYSKSGAVSSNAYRVIIPLDEYARALGYEIDERPDAPDPVKEKKRANEARKNARKRINQDLDILLACKAEWQEAVKKQNRDFGKMNFFDHVSIQNGYIILDFGRQIIKEYLAHLQLTHYPLALLSVDGRKENAYQIGLAISDHYNNIFNHIGTGNPDLLSVKNLLEKTTLPSIDAVRKYRQSWEERIKEPFEQALEELHEVGFLENWEYRKAKDIELTNEEAGQIDSFEVFNSLYVHYAIKDPADLTPDIERKKEEIGKRANNKKRG
jgi:hypothetical protein